ncbi:MAG: hypothetical protein HY719_17120 [Planctomycetes bacterium]|nr:hypothetical protein [Planctomycetota bacterium]
MHTLRTECVYYGEIGGTIWNEQQIKAGAAMKLEWSLGFAVKCASCDRRTYFEVGADCAHSEIQVLPSRSQPPGAPLRWSDYWCNGCSTVFSVQGAGLIGELVSPRRTDLLCLRCGAPLESAVSFLANHVCFDGLLRSLIGKPTLGGTRDLQWGLFCVVGIVDSVPCEQKAKPFCAMKGERAAAWLDELWVRECRGDIDLSKPPDSPEPAGGD